MHYGCIAKSSFQYPNELLSINLHGPVRNSADICEI